MLPAMWRVRILLSMVVGVHGSAKNREPVKGMPDDRILMLFLIEFPMNFDLSYCERAKYC